MSAWTVPSRSQPGVRHLVTRRWDGQLECSCPAARYGRMCRHRRAVMTILIDPPNETPPMEDMMTTAVIPAATASMPTTSEWDTMRSMATIGMQSGMLPAHIKSEQAALFVAMKGRELNIPATYAWSNIAVINGKPVCSAELMLALIYRDHGGQAIRFEDTSDTVCRLTYQRRDAGERRPFAFTLDQARTAGLTSDTWRKYPAAMLRARAVSAVARMAFADSIAGMYTPEEMGAAVEVTSDGEVVMAEPAPGMGSPSASVPEPAPAPPSRFEPGPDQVAPPDQALLAARAVLQRALKASGQTWDDALALAVQVWPHVDSVADLGTLAASQLDQLADVVLGYASIGTDEQGTPRILPVREEVLR